LRILDYLTTSFSNILAQKNEIYGGGVLALFYHVGKSIMSVMQLD
jgi:hypothetical protein